MPATNYLMALLHGKCPRCREGKIFKYAGSNLARFSVMNEACPHCGVRLEPEPGFYQGAMYVSYAITVAGITIIGLILYLLLDNPSEWVYIGTIIPILFLIVPWNYRYSRILYLYWFGGLSSKKRGA